MAIKVNGTTVINDSRALQNIASLDATTTATINAVVGSSDLAAATGGTVTTDGDYKVHKFTSNGTFSVTTPGPIEYLIVSGGGSGGRGTSGTGQGGGGAGGHYLGAALLTVASDYDVVVGAGGIKNTSYYPSAQGQVSAIYGSEIFNNTVPGGGQGGGYSYTTAQDGASGGGGLDSGGLGGKGTYPFGNDGGDGVSGQDGGPGGGGAGGVGADGNSTTYNGAAGGAGVAYSITGSSLYYAGGGGGGARASGSGGPGGSGVGGNGGTMYGEGTAPTANTGSGGGGGGSDYGPSSNGAAGVVIFRYKFQ